MITQTNTKSYFAPRAKGLRSAVMRAMLLLAMMLSTLAASAEKIKAYCSKCKSETRCTVISIEEPTCIREGYKGVMCDNCGSAFVVDIPALGHDMSDYTTVSPTCTEQGYEISSCQREGCTYSILKSFVAALGHSEGSDGRCTRCGSLLTLLLADGSDNDLAIGAAEGQTCKVRLSDRTLYKDGAWNTLCLPFDVSNENLGEIYEDNPVVMELDVDGTYNDETGSHQTGLEGNTLYLYFKPVDLSPESDDMMVAGRPYLIKWDNVGETIENPVFSGVAINTDTYDVTSEDGTVTFKGTYGFLSFAEPDENILFLGDGNNVYYPEAGASLGAFRAYFQLNTSTPVRAFRMNFGDVKTQGIVSATLNDRGNDKLYMLDGRKLDKPVRKGLYIKNGRKVVIK